MGFFFLSLFFLFYASSEIVFCALDNLRYYLLLHMYWKIEKGKGLEARYHNLILAMLSAKSFLDLV